jgi:hypothetical protein
VTRKLSVSLCVFVRMLKASKAGGHLKGIGALHDTGRNGIRLVI